MHVKNFRFPGRRLNKKAQEAESQLNWIFILIVGAIILAFFVLIVVKQRAASEAKFAGKISQQLNTILAGAKVSSGTIQEIPTPEVSIRFTCNDYYIGPTSQRLGNRVIFAPEYVEGTKIITWTLDWNVPFKVTSLLYITSPLVRYVVVGKTSTETAAKKLYDSLPSKLNKKMYSLSEYNGGSITDEGDKYVRFIFVDTGAVTTIPSGFDKVEVSALVVDTSNKQVQFLESSASDSTSFTSFGKHTYIEEEVLYGAIFSTKSDDYKCLMERAYSRVNMVSRVYYEKLNAISSIYASTDCEGYYSNNPDLMYLINATQSYPPKYSIIGSEKSKLKETNTRLQMLSCPLIY